MPMGDFRTAAFDKVSSEKPQINSQYSQLIDEILISLRVILTPRTHSRVFHASLTH
jgi:hypothetical protein